MGDIQGDMRAIAAEFPARLMPGVGLGGPEYAGCFNTGRRPVLKVPAIRVGAGRGRLTALCILVGEQNDVEEAVRGSATRWTVGDKRGKHPELRVWNFRTRGPAREKFLELCKPVVEFNRRVRAEAVQARADLASGDPTRIVRGALAAADL